MTDDRPRRWVSEARVLAEMERLADESMSRVAEYATLAEQAARADAAYRKVRAQRFLRARADGASSALAAEAVADADEGVSAAYLDRLTTSAAATACREALAVIRASQDALRTAAASARDGVIGPGHGGGAR